jgi:hypothetical protein
LYDLELGKAKIKTFENRQGKNLMNSSFAKRVLNLCRPGFELRTCRAQGFGLRDITSVLDNQICIKTGSQPR